MITSDDYKIKIKDPTLNDSDVSLILETKATKKHLIMRTCEFISLAVTTINPKSVSLLELYGEFEAKSREGEDGILTHLMRKALN